MKHLVTKRHLIFSAENAHHDQEIHWTHREAMVRLANMGFKVIEVNGQYDKPEKSIMVYNFDDSETEFLISIAESLGQDSVILSDNGKHKLLFTNGENKGKYYQGQGTEFFESKPDNYYSQIGDAYFSHNLDFSKLI